MAKKYEDLAQVKQHVDEFFKALDTVQDVLGSIDGSFDARNRIYVYRAIKRNITWSDDLEDLKSLLTAEAAETKNPEIKKLIERWIKANLA